MALSKNILELEERETVDFLHRFGSLWDLGQDIAIRSKITEPLEKIFLCVGQPIISNPKIEPGDIDIIFKFPSGKSIAAEVKRVKYRAINNFRDIRFKGVEKVLKKGISQVKAMQRFGFYKTFLLIVAQYDGSIRKTSDNQPVYFPMTNHKYFKLKELILSKVGAEFGKKVGVATLEVNQATPKDINLTGSISKKVHLYGVGKKQRKEITAKIMGMK